MKHLRVLVALLALSAPVAGVAEVCSYDAAPAATLLLPYFEVDLADPNGRTTLFSVTSASAGSTLANVTLWTDLGVPVVSFPLFLTGYDVQTFNLRDLLVHGLLPVTGPLVTTPGPFSEARDFPGCEDFLPLPDTLPAALLADVRAALTGGPAPILFGGRCSGADLGDEVARGSITVDTLNACTALNPTLEGYFGPDGVASSENVLWGDFYLVDVASDSAQGAALTAIQAEEGFFEPGSPTFYGRFVGNDASDGREPLPSIWALRYAQNPSSNTDLIVWQSGVGVPESFDCGSPPPPMGVPLEFLCWFDEEENPMCNGGCIADPPLPGCGGLLPFPLESNRVRADSSALPAPWSFGWLYTNLGIHATPSNLARRQSSMTALTSGLERFSVAVSGTPLDRACGPVEFPDWVPRFFASEGDGEGAGRLAVDSHEGGR